MHTPIIYYQLKSDVSQEWLQCLQIQIDTLKNEIIQQNSKQTQLVIQKQQNILNDLKQQINILVKKDQKYQFSYDQIINTESISVSDIQNDDQVREISSENHVSSLLEEIKSQTLYFKQTLQKIQAHNDSNLVLNLQQLLQKGTKIKLINRCIYIGESTTEQCRVKIWDQNKTKGRKIYIGQLQGRERHGYGVMEYFNGFKYIGNWERDHYHGKGEFTHPNGVKIQGIFNQSVFESGNVIYIDGTKQPIENGKETVLQGLLYDYCQVQKLEEYHSGYGSFKSQPESGLTSLTDSSEGE
ncbi:MORN_repeat-containing protein [Hexamita inflata]|uniref:MORN repeat-containing protein n=1 Tax=Hexamita inflata TaxID=28002 RepID=A0AA86V0E2_9EUKA|nr:MORN repeat-containing protein [Hexamita inflata]